MCLAAIYWARIDKIYFANSRDEASQIGFDDSFLYGEMVKPINIRKIPTIHLPLDDAKQVFQEWKEKEDKNEY